MVDAAATALLIALTEAGAPTAALVACGLVGGFAVPNIGGALRALWPELLARRDELHLDRVRARLRRDRAAVHRSAR